LPLTVRMHSAPHGPDRDTDTPLPSTTDSVVISANPVISIAPLVVTYRASIPPSMKDHATCRWYLDGKPFAVGAGGQRTLDRAGEYVLQLVVTDADGREYTARKELTVLEKVESKDP